jgi:hypothetical protein
MDWVSLIASRFLPSSASFSARNSSRSSAARIWGKEWLFTDAIPCWAAPQLVPNKIPSAAQKKAGTLKFQSVRID